MIAIMNVAANRSQFDSVNKKKSIYHSIRIRRLAWRERWIFSMCILFGCFGPTADQSAQRIMNLIASNCFEILLPPICSNTKESFILLDVIGSGRMPSFEIGSHT